MTTHLSEIVPDPPSIFEIQVHRTRDGGWKGHLSFAGVSRFPLPGWFVYDVAKRALVIERVSRSGDIVEIGGHL